MTTPYAAPGPRATVRHWIAGARPRTLPAAVAPVLAGTAIALHEDSFVAGKALLALGLALALQIGVNYANDYSDGIRGTDADRVGPLRLVGSGLASPRAVKLAALTALGVGAVFGLVLAALTAWWLVAIGAVCLLAAWGYTGGSSPYGYRGLGEVMVFVFFGLVAVVGTTYVQVEGTDGLGAAVLAGVGIGALACAILVANNLRDIPSDREVGKRTLAVVLGDPRTRLLYAGLVAVSVVSLVAIAALTSWWALLAAVAVLPLVPALRTVLGGAEGRGLIPVIQQTGLAELVYGLGLLVGAGMIGR